MEFGARKTKVEVLGLDDYQDPTDGVNVLIVITKVANLTRTNNPHAEGNAVLGIRPSLSSSERASMSY